jgi:hypothetical protein
MGAIDAFQGLNEKQRAAARFKSDLLLIIVGAGTITSTSTSTSTSTGKTDTFANASLCISRAAVVLTESFGVLDCGDAVDLMHVVPHELDPWLVQARSTCV